MRPGKVVILSLLTIMGAKFLSKKSATVAKLT
jgi:hypothetical protein